MSPSPEVLRAMLEQDASLIEQLQILLEQERELLESRQHEPLEALIEAKNPILEQLGEHSRQRQNWLQHAQLSTDHQGWLTLLAANPANETLIEPWQNLTERFLACQELNEINGKIIGRSRQTLGQLLSILRGQSGGPQLYNAQGSTAPEKGSSRISEA